MSKLNKIIQHMVDNETEAGCWVDTDIGNQIVALLRAGAEMRIAEYARDVSKANAAWDAALKEETSISVAGV